MFFGRRHSGYSVTVVILMPSLPQWCLLLAATPSTVANPFDIFGTLNIAPRTEAMLNRPLASAEATTADTKDTAASSAAHGSTTQLVTSSPQTLARFVPEMPISSPMSPLEQSPLPYIPLHGVGVNVVNVFWERLTAAMGETTTDLGLSGGASPGWDWRHMGGGESKHSFASLKRRGIDLVMTAVAFCP